MALLFEIKYVRKTRRGKNSARFFLLAHAVAAACSAKADGTGTVRWAQR